MDRHSELRQIRHEIDRMLEIRNALGPLSWSAFHVERYDQLCAREKQLLRAA